ncbi:MAG TPA: RNA methyltransferase [Gemmatimonadaceae bacterium]|nr:RNA methyltransferase [Gemmatimonadaceae bacterium]
MARDLQRRRARERERSFVVEGIRAGEELLRSPLRVRGALFTPGLSSTLRGAALHAAIVERGLPAQCISEPEMRSAGSTETPQGVVLIAHMPDWSLEALPLGERVRLLVLDMVQDPGNVGSMLRSAAAFGVAATLALPGTVDLWNGKVVRSAMGALFHHPAFSVTPSALDAFLRAQKIPLWAADAAGETVDALPRPTRLAIVMGNEGSGLSEPVRALTARRVAIPVAPHVESLNVAVAAGILLYQLRP